MGTDLRHPETEHSPVAASGSTSAATGSTSAAIGAVAAPSPAALAGNPEAAGAIERIVRTFQSLIPTMIVEIEWLRAALAPGQEH
jgi:hypothetical protein